MVCDEERGKKMLPPLKEGRKDRREMSVKLNKERVKSVGKLPDGRA